MAAQASEATLRELETLVTNVASLLTQLEATLTGLSKGQKPATSAAETPDSDIDALAIARDSASLIKSHTTKLSLLIITEPFTPSAISKVLRELISVPVPALASAAELCDSARYTDGFSKALNGRCHSALRELRTFILKIPRDGNVLSSEEQAKSTDGSGKGSMAMTGVLWSICDDLVQFSKSGVPGFLSQKADETKLTLKDIMEELKEWGEEEEDEDEEDDGAADGVDFDSAVDVNGSHSGGLETEHTAAQTLLDNLMNSTKAIPRHDPDNIRGRLDVCLRRLRLCTLLCQAVSKRRFRAAPPFPAKDAATTTTIERALTALKGLPDSFEDAAMSFYDLDPAGIDSGMEKYTKEAVGIAKMLSKPWTGERDEFTDWAEKFEVEMSK